MPYSPISDGSALTAAHLLANVYNQVISQVTSSTRPGSPAEGQMITESDTDLNYQYSGSGWVLFGGYGAWTSYTPTLTQSGSVTFTVGYSAYMKIGRLVIYNVSLSVTGTGTANNAVTISTPFTASTSGYVVGSGIIVDSSVPNRYPGITLLHSTTTIALYDATQATNNLRLGQTGAAFAAGLASGDAVVMSAIYEATT